MPTEVPKIVTRLQLGENKPKVTVAELSKIFGDEHEDLDYPDRAENSELGEAFDYIQNDPTVAQNLCEVLDISDDFEEQLGIRETSGMRWIYFWQKINKIGGVGGEVLAQRWSQKVKDGVFDDLPDGIKYVIMHHCVKTDKSLFTEEEIEGYKQPEGKDHWKWTTILREYNPEKALEEMIAGGKKYRENMGLFFSPKIIDAKLGDKVKSSVAWKNMDDNRKALFLGRD